MFSVRKADSLQLVLARWWQCIYSNLHNVTITTEWSHIVEVKSSTSYNGSMHYNTHTHTHSTDFLTIMRSLDHSLKPTIFTSVRTTVVTTTTVKARLSCDTQSCLSTCRRPVDTAWTTNRCWLCLEVGLIANLAEYPSHLESCFNRVVSHDDCKLCVTKCCCCYVTN